MGPTIERGNERSNERGSGGCRPALPPGRFVDLPGRGRTFIRELDGPHGAPVVMLLHGWTATADLNWFPCFEPLAEHFRVIALDQRGHGRGIRSREPFRLSQCADDAAALAHELGVSRVIAAGYSMGGPVGQLLWQRHRDLVGGLVLCATSATFSGTLRERMMFGVAAGTSVIATRLPVQPITNTALAAVSVWNSRRGRPWWGFDEVARHDWSQIVEAGRELGRFDSRPWIGEVRVPTAVVVTEHDDVVPTRRQRALADAIPRALVHTVPGGHSACTLTPELFVPNFVGACIEVARRDRSTLQFGLSAGKVLATSLHPSATAA